MAEATARLRVVRESAPARKNNLATVEGRAAHFKEQLVQLELSRTTVRLYCTYTRNADWWCEQQGYSLRNVPTIVLSQYIELRPKTYSVRLLLRASLTHYWRIFKRKNPPLWLVKVPRKPKRVCRALSESDAARLATVARERADKAGLAVLLALYQGLRREEISAVAWHDFNDGWLSVLGKGEQPAKIPLHPVVADAIARAERDDPVWVFPARQFKIDRKTEGGPHTTPVSIWKWVKTVAAEAGIEEVTTHSLRHTCLATANDSTGDLRAVQDFARHAKVDTTAGYTRTTEKRLRAVMQSLNYEPGAAARHEMEHSLHAKLSRLSDEDLGVLAQLVAELVAEASS
ncbi:MAG: tyrosine-type recombinase/integrase [Actinomycetota bacterium]|nr:tyrosine-type recombinase/integrase [Actinomycetota bacterium]